MSAHLTHGGPQIHIGLKHHSDQRLEIVRQIRLVFGSKFVIFFQLLLYHHLIIGAHEWNSVIEYNKNANSNTPYIIAEGIVGFPERITKGIEN